MDPISALSLAATVVKLAGGLAEAVLRVGALYREVRDIDDSVDGLGQELEAFKLHVTVLDSELRRGNLFRLLQRWWNGSEFTNLLANTSSTIARFEAVFGDISRQRKVLKNIRQYWRSRQYDTEIRQLRLRLQISTSSLHLPIILANM